jgi:hypothetical protein
MEVPLLQLGPNQTYGTKYFGEGNRIVAVEGGSPSALLTSPPKHRSAQPKTFLDRLLKIDRVFFSPAAAAIEVLETISVHETPNRKPRKNKLAKLITSLFNNISHEAEIVFCKVNQLTLFGRNPLLHKDHDDEPHAQTTRSNRAHSTMPKRSWILANDARTSRTNRRQQSNSIRTNRSVNTQRRINKRTEQSTLFIDC